MKTVQSKIKIILILMFLTVIPQFFCSASSKKDVTLSFTGDIIMHIPVKNSAIQHDERTGNKEVSTNNNGFDFLFEGVRTVLKASDIVQGNMEFPVSPPFQSKPWIFNCPPHVLEALKDAGFTMVTIANNHILDQSIDGLCDTVSFIRGSGLDYIGAGISEEESRTGIVREIRGIKIGFMAYTGVLNYNMPSRRKSGHLNWFYDRDAVNEDIHRLRGQCDYLIMTVHAGDEYALSPQDKDREFMKGYLDQGVDLIVGHHPHVLQPIEAVTAKDGRKAYIFYSIGNFISNQSSSIPIPGKGSALSTRDSVILNVYLKKKDEALFPAFELIPVTTINRRDPQSGKRTIQTRLLVDEIKEKKSLLVGPSGVKYKYLEREVAELQSRLAVMHAVLFQNKGLESITMQDLTGE